MAFPRSWLIVAFTTLYCQLVSGLAIPVRHSDLTSVSHVLKGEILKDEGQIREKEIVTLPHSLCPDCDIADSELLRSLNLTIRHEIPAVASCHATRKPGLILNGAELQDDTPTEDILVNKSGQVHLDLRKHKPLAISWFEVCHCVKSIENECQELEIDLSLTFSNVGKTSHPGLIYSTRVSRHAVLGHNFVFASGAQISGTTYPEEQEDLIPTLPGFSKFYGSTFDALRNSLSRLQISFSAAASNEEQAGTDTDVHLEANQFNNSLDPSIKSALLITCLVFFTLAPFAVLFLRWLLRRHPQIRAELAARQEEKRNRRLYRQAACRLKLVQLKVTLTNMMPWSLLLQPTVQPLQDVEASRTPGQLRNPQRFEPATEYLLSSVGAEKSIEKGGRQTRSDSLTRNSHSGSLGWNSSAASSAPPIYSNSSVVDDASSIIATSSRWYGSEKEDC